MYDVYMSTRAARELKGLDRTIQARVLAVMTSLGDNPRPVGCIKIQGRDGVWRVRVGDYRIGYTVDDETHQVEVAHISHRSDFYKS